MSSQLTNFAIIKFTISFILGILLSQYVNASFNVSAFVTLGVFVCTTLLIFSTKPVQRNIYFVDIMVIITIISIGFMNVQIHNPKNHQHHYTNKLKTHKDSSYTLQYRISEILKPSLYHDKYIVELNSIDTISATGKLLLNIEKDSTNKRSVDDVIVSHTKFLPLIPPRNPFQFNYQEYLNKKHIYHQLTIESYNTFIVDSIANTLSGHASNFREIINQKLKKYNFSKDELAIINALLLGQRTGISKDVYENYSKAGAIHILAISGLHIGIILVLLQFLFKPLDLIKRGPFIKTILIVFLLWCYAIIAGLSPSVVRATTMFTIFAIAMNLKRPTNVYNTVAVSMFVLLLINPSFLFEIGFQMSYMAVLAIVSIVPILNSLWKPRYYFIEFFWKILTVTCAAQLGVLPISLYHFHQFPGLFFISNLVILPFLGLILGLGITIILLALCDKLPNVIADFFGSIISTMNRFVSWVSQHEGFLFENLTFPIVYIILSYLFIISVLNAIKLRSFKSSIISIAVIISFQAFLFYEKFSTTSDTFIVFHKSRKSIIGLKSQNELRLFHNLPDSIITEESSVISFKIGEKIKWIKNDSIQNIHRYQNKSILVVDSYGIYNVKRFHPDFVLLRDSPKINLTRLIDSIQPELIISDGSNYRSYEERWKATCKAKKIPFHQTNEKGAFIYFFK